MSVNGMGTRVGSAPHVCEWDGDQGGQCTSCLGVGWGPGWAVPLYIGPLVKFVYLPLS